jgi:ABC-type bacteriocin/lantibiotic exporter with double-glycine peptidase domain
MVFSKVFIGLCKTKTRVLVTNTLDFLHLADTIVVIKQGRVALQGSY